MSTETPSILEDEEQENTHSHRDLGKPPLPPSRKKMKARSEVWDHFTVFYDEDGEKKGKCNYCPKSYLGDSKRYGTSTLTSHMKSCIHSPFRKDPKQSELIVKSPDDNEATAITAWKFDPILARKKLVEMIIKDELAFSFVDGEGFIEFIGVIQPKFKIPSRWSISRDVYQLFLDEKLKLRDYFKKSSCTVCITTDTWTSMQKASYMCITAHYVDKHWSLNKKIINFCPVEGHKGEEMGRQIDTCLREWGIARVLAVIVDNASANDTYVDYLRGRLTSRGCDVVKGVHLHMRCSAHILNLIVHDGLKVINPSIKKIRDAIRYVRHSPARLTRFKECCVEENIECKSLLCLDVPTRWNSTYLMLSMAIKFEKAFERFEVEDPHFRMQLSADANSGVPTPADWNVARKISDILQVFYEITLRVSASLYVTSHLLLHEIDTVGNLLKEWSSLTINEEVTHPFLKEIGEKMQLKFEKYWGNPKSMNKLIYLIVVLDPRYKFRFIEFYLEDEYGDESSRLMFDLKIALNELYDHYRVLNPYLDTSTRVSQSASSTLVDSEGPPQKKRRYASDRFKQFQSQSDESLSKNDLELYLAEETLSGEKEDFEILKWWDVHKCRFPILTLVARDLLAMPISTVSSESAFSTGGRILDPFRSSLTPRIVEGLICVQNWLRRSKQPTIEEDLASLEKHEEGISSIGLKENDDKGKQKET